MKYCFKTIILLVLLNTSCMWEVVNINHEKEIKKFESHFLPELFQSFSSDIYKEENFLRLINPIALYALGYCGIFFKHSSKEEEFDSIILELEKQSIFKCKIEDTLFYSVPNFKETFPENKFPTPDLNDWVYTIRDSIDVKNSIIFGLKNKQGEYFNQKGIEQIKKLVKDIDVTSIGKGYSNGAIVDYSDKEIIYWIIIW